MATRVTAEVWQNGQKHLVARRPDGKFGPGAQTFRPTEIWVTREGATLALTDRVQGRFAGPVVKVSL